MLEILIKIDQDFRLILIGQGELEDKLQNYAKSKEIDKYIVKDLIIVNPGNL